MNMQQLRERYAAPEIPKCRVCGGVLTVQRAGGGPTIWGCTGMIDDPTGERNWIYAEGRSCADEHYERSRWSDYRQGGDADVIELIDALEAAERERDELRAEQAEHDEQIARMESKFSLAKRALDSKTARCDRAEAELRRRDAAAGEPVAWLNDAYLGRGVLDGETGKEDQGPGYIPVYRIPPPAALSPEYHAAMKKLRHTLANCNRLNYCAEALQDVENSLVLGAQLQKVVEFPKPHAHLIWIQAGRAPDDYWDDVEVSRSPKDRCCDGSERYAVFSEFEVKDMLDAANVKWEVKK